LKFESQTNKPTNIMPKKTAPVAPAVLSLDEMATMSVNEAADGFAGRYSSRSRAFVEMGKFAYHLIHRASIPKGQTLYGILKKRGVPEGSVHNAMQVEKFISAFVIPGLVPESRADEIITFRIANQCARIMGGKSAVTMTAEELAPLLIKGEKSAIGAELDSLQEHGLTIAAREEAETAKAAEEERLAKLNAAATKLPASTPAAETPAPVETPAAAPQHGKVETPAETPSAETPAETPPVETPTNISPISSGSSHTGQTVTAAEIIAEIAATEMRSYDLAPGEMEQVCVKLGEWIELLSATIENEKKQTEKVA
jgi:hypothetical protein